MKIIAIIALLLICVSGDDYDWDAGVCPDGTEQSPIDYPSDIVESTGYCTDHPLNLHFDYERIAAVIEGEDDDNDDSSYIEWYSEEESFDFIFELANVHMHSPAEHTVDGDAYDLEMHMVHYDADADDDG